MQFTIADNYTSVMGIHKLYGTLPRLWDGTSTDSKTQNCHNFILQVWKCTGQWTLRLTAHSACWHNQLCVIKGRMDNFILKHILTPQGSHTERRMESCSSMTTMSTCIDVKTNTCILDTSHRLMAVSAKSYITQIFMNCIKHNCEVNWTMQILYHNYELNWTEQILCHNC